MYLNDQERATFFKLFFDLLYCVNKEHKIIRGFGNERHPKSVDSQKAYQVRVKLFENPAWIEDYIQKYGAELTKGEREILLSWRHYFVMDQFVVMRHLAKYSVFMTFGDEDTTRLYGITGLNHPFADFFAKSDLPVMVDALILPFGDKIIYDGLFSSHNIGFGSGIRNSFTEQYNISKAKFGIIGQLPFDDSNPKEVSTPAPKKSVKATPGESREKADAIAPLITRFCEEKLGAEFTDVCLFALEKLRRKRPSPLLKGKANTWACGIVYAIASNNFVFDKSQLYFMTVQEIADGFGLSKSTAQNKSAEINRLLDISYFSPEYMIDSIRESQEGLFNTMKEMEDLWRRLK